MTSGLARFAGAAVIVTGGAHGIGRACAVRVAEEGARVAVADLDRDAAQQVAGSRRRPLYHLGRVGEPEDIAAAVAFLASPDAAWITEHTLPVDGGLLTGPGGAPEVAP